MKLFVFLALSSIVLFSGCPASYSEPDFDSPESYCGYLCGDALREGVDLTNGPCLSDNAENFPEGWVCDIAHSPRESIDNLAENQCAEYRQGLANHFVELTPTCRTIQVN